MKKSKRTQKYVRYMCQKNVRLPGMSGCPKIGPAVRLPAARNYARLPGYPVYSVAWYARLPGTMPGTMSGCPVCPAVRSVRYARLPGMPGCPEICPECPAPRHRHYSTLGRPTPAFSGAAGRLHQPARATVRHDAPRSRPAQGPRQRRPLQSNVRQQSSLCCLI